MSDRVVLTVAVLGGTGNIGPGLALRWAHAGYKVLIGSRQAEKAQRVATELNEQLEIDSIEGMENAEAARRAEICVLTVNSNAHKAALESLRDALEGKILIDTTARVDFRHPHPPAAPSAPRMAQDLLGPGVRVVGAFQTVPAHVLKTDLGRSLDIDVLVCSDDGEAAQETIKLVQGCGLNAYHVGGLDYAVVAEGLTALIISLNKRYESKAGSIRIVGINP